MEKVTFLNEKEMQDSNGFIVVLAQTYNQPPQHHSLGIRNFNIYRHFDSFCGKTMGGGWGGKTWQEINIVNDYHELCNLTRLKPIVNRRVKLLDRVIFVRYRSEQNGFGTYANGTRYPLWDIYYDEFTYDDIKYAEWDIYHEEGNIFFEKDIVYIKCFEYHIR
jgi:hypothetical protein